jgi:hypothetical protein
MRTYVVEINGRGIAAFNAESRMAAEDFVSGRPAHGRAFRDDLMVLKNDGRDLWDGKSDLSLRNPLPDEQAKFDASLATALVEHEIEDEDDGWVLFLIPVTDPTDEVDEEVT